MWYLAKLETNVKTGELKNLLTKKTAPKSDAVLFSKNYSSAGGIAEADCLRWRKV